MQAVTFSVHQERAAEPEGSQEAFEARGRDEQLIKSIK